MYLYSFDINGRNSRLIKTDIFGVYDSFRVFRKHLSLLGICELVCTMGHECQILFEISKIFWLIRLVFASVLPDQYFELPYGNVILPSLFSAGKNNSHFNGKSRVDGVTNFPTANSSVSEKNENTAASLKIDEDRITEDDLSFGDLYHNLTANTGKRNNSRETEKK